MNMEYIEMNYFMYMEFGEKRFLSETITSITSLVQAMPDTEKYYIVVLATHPKELKENLTVPLDHIITHEILQNVLNEWTENETYFYQAKVKAIQYFMDLYASDVIFIDSDTVIYRDLLGLFDELSDHFIMNFQCRGVHELLEMVEGQEEALYSDEKINLRYRQRIKCFSMLYEGISYNQYTYKATKDSKICNSGVIGIAYRHRKILNEVEKLVLYLYHHSDYGASEEVAFSVVFQKYGTLMLCDDMLTHYYECKETRLVAGLLMDILAADERDQLTQLIGKYGVRDISQYDIHISECSAFMDYVRIYKGKQEAYFGKRFEGKCYTSEEKLKAMERINKRCFRKWIRNEMTDTRSISVK